MDLHIVPGVKAGDAAEAHRLDVLLQEEYHCKCMTYWIDEGRGHVFCLIDASGKEAVENMHNRAIQQPRELPCFIAYWLPAKTFRSIPTIGCRMYLSE